MSAELRPDEKICPFCAEVIRAAAVKCRYCHSDLPAEPAAEAEVVAVAGAGSAHDIRETAPQAPEALEPEPATLLPAPALKTEPDGSVLNRAAVVLLVVSLLLALGIAALIYSARPDDLRTADGQVTADSYRSAALSAGSANVSTILSYSYKTLAADEKAARAVISSGYAKQYAAVMAKSGPEATKAKLTQKATVAAASLLSLEKDHAQLMLFVNRVTTADDSQHQVAYSDRLLVEMSRRDGDWIVSKVTPF